MGHASCGCGGPAAPMVTITKRAGPAKVLATEPSWNDRLGGWRVRWGIGRMRYLVDPGLYRIGEPGRQSPVLVTANYKLTVDAVRSQLTGLDVWLLVLDTRGVNVWCAAGKGTFGTEELVRRMALVDLASVVDHRMLVVPQLGATGVAAHEIKRATGFLVRYGPVRARDIRAYLAAGMNATAEMRRVSFTWKERMVLAPMEAVSVLKLTLGILIALALLEALVHQSLGWHVAAAFVPLLAAILAGSVIVPLFLPWLPSRVFAVKGAVAGAACVGAALVALPGGALETAGTALIGVALASYMGMMFTGTTTFTNLAGARLEVRWGLPVILAAAFLGAVLRVAAVFA